MYTDAPIVGMDEDALERAEFATSLAGQVLLPTGSPGVVFGLEGAWGEGKTSILNLVEASVRKDDSDAVLVRFDPWAVTDLSTLTEAFLVQLAAAVGRLPKAGVAQKAAQRVLKFAKFIAPVKLLPGVEPWGTLVTSACEGVAGSVGAAFGETDNSARKKAVEDALAELERPIVVMIDDVDRLPPDAVRTLFQLVKAVANFRRTAYLLAYDPEPVAQALSYGGVYKGKDFLEKIIQVPIRLPRWSYLQKKTFLRGALEDLLARNEIKLTQFETEAVEEAITSGGITHSIRHPRDVYRVLNRAVLPVRRTRGEVNFADVLTFEALEVLFPSVANAIRREPDRFVEGAGEGDPTFPRLSGRDDKKKDGAQQKFFDELAKGLEPHQPADLEAMIGFLFPDAVNTYKTRGEERAKAELRVSDSETLHKLLAKGDLSGRYSARAAKTFLEVPQERDAIVADVLKDDLLSGWFRFVSIHLERARIEDPGRLVDDIYALCVKHRDALSRDGYMGAAELLRVLLKFVENSERGELLLRAVRNRGALHLGECLLLKLRKEHGLWGTTGGAIDEERLSVPAKEVIEEATAAWIAAVEEESQDWRALVGQDGAVSILFRWGQFSPGQDFQRVRCFVEKLIRDDEGLQAFVDQYPKGILFEGVETLVSDPRFLKERVETMESLRFAAGKREDLMGCLDKALAAAEDRQPEQTAAEGA